MIQVSSASFAHVSPTPPFFPFSYFLELDAGLTHNLESYIRFVSSVCVSPPLLTSESLYFEMNWWLPVTTSLVQGRSCTVLSSWTVCGAGRRCCLNLSLELLLQYLLVTTSEKASVWRLSYCPISSSWPPLWTYWTPVIQPNSEVTGSILQFCNRQLCYWLLLA